MLKIGRARDFDAYGARAAACVCEAMSSVAQALSSLASPVAMCIVYVDK